MGGKPYAESVKILAERVAGKRHAPDKRITSIETAIRQYLPEMTQLEIPVIKNVGWRSRETDQDLYFDFSDTSILRYHREQARLEIQPGRSPEVEEALGALPYYFFTGLEALVEVLKQVFPDWHRNSNQLAETVAKFQFTSEGSMLPWQQFWPKGRAKRQAANPTAPCQAELISDWASVLALRQQHQHLLGHAPTGLGKTIAALVPALAWVAQDPDRRQLFYLVNRVTQHHNPLRELRAGLAEIFAAETGQALRVVDLVGRRLLCSYPDTYHLNEFCRQSRQKARFDLLPEEVLSWEAVRTHLETTVCPYHTLQGLMPQAHVVIADYWWFFSQLARPENDRPLLTFNPANVILVVDEAHNLPLRVRSELDVDLSFREIVAVLPKLPYPIRQYLSSLLAMVQQVEPETGLAPADIRSKLGDVAPLLEMLASTSQDETLEDEITWVERVCNLLVQRDEAVVIYRTEDALNGSQLVLRLVDPTPVLRAGYQRVYASLTMSGSLAAPTDTQQEMQYLISLFGLPADQTVARKYASPFSMRNQYWLCNEDTYGTYQAREYYWGRYAEHITEVGQVTPGVTAVFFSSYDFLSRVQNELPQAEGPLIVAESREDAEGSHDGGHGLIGYETELRQRVETFGRAYLFAVYKGKLSEGASFNDNLIKSLICVSVPLEYPGLYHRRLEEHYQSLFNGIAQQLGDNLVEKAHEYAWERPSLSLVLQACGRGIRHQTDRCAFLLLDKRYTNVAWRRFLPSGPYNLSRPAATIKTFFRPAPEQDDTAWDPAITAACQPGSPQETGE